MVSAALGALVGVLARVSVTPLISVVVVVTNPGGDLGWFLGSGAIVVGSGVTWATKSIVPAHPLCL